VADETACPPRSRGWVATPALIGVAVAVACMSGYAELAEDLRISPAVYAFDMQVTAAVQGWRGPALTLLFRAITWGASTVPVTVATVVAIAVLMWRNRYREALLVAGVVAIGTGLGTIAKQVTERPRPPVASALIELPTSYSFPSGHTLAALLLWTVVSMVVWRTTERASVRWLVIAAASLLMVLTALSRVYLGVHWPSDTVASLLLGGAWLAVCVGGFLSWERAVGPAEC
jgi:undecaprenyl-diphosphatase